MKKLIDNAFSGNTIGGYEFTNRDRYFVEKAIVLYHDLLMKDVDVLIDCIKGNTDAEEALTEWRSKYGDGK